MEKTPRKSPRLNKFVVVVDSPQISSSRPSGRSNECIVINSSSSYKVQQKDDFGADTKLKGKEKLVEVHYPHDSDFEDEIPLSKRLRVNNDQDLKNVDGGSVSKDMNGLSQKWTRFINNKRKKATQVPLKIKKKQSCWCSYINVNVFVDITKLLEKIGSVHLFKESPFGYLLGLSQLIVQPQIIRSLVHHLSNNRDDMFVFDINGKEMHFELREFLIYFDHLQKGMFRKYVNQYTFEDLVFMDEEFAIIEAENLTVLADIPFNKKSKRDRSIRQNENLQIHCVVRQNVKDLPHSSAQKVGSDPSLSYNKDLQKIAQEVVKVRNELEKFEKNVDAKFVKMKAFMDPSFKHIIQELKSLQNDVSTNKDLGGVSVDFEINRKTPPLDDFVMPNMRESQLVALETGQTYVSSLVEVESENICITPLEVAKAEKPKFNQFGVIEGENTFISPVQHVRTKIPGKYAQSPYTNLSESGGTSVNTVKYCLWRHHFVNYKGFYMYSEGILYFKKWVDSKLSKKREKKTSFFTAASNLINAPFEFGVGRVDLMDWFHPLAYPGQPWRDLHVDVIMYYLRKFCKYGPDNSARVTTTDPFFISLVVQIHDAWEANDKDESLISIHHEVAQYIRADRILANTP
ncbi:hypothetical protein KY284_007044 [Solanum tuberosum]|nr:hypothetical protein KY284_007044 [Solanum tuberosum]